MGKIIILDDITASKIAAGEVIERPASVIKELVENSIDASATNITVEIRNGGISYIRVIDNGSGIAADDVEISFERHATSKIRRAEDLESVSSMGFRGEALASIAAVSDVLMLTRVRGEIQGVSINIKGGVVKEIKPAGCQEGTSITVRELFYNTPARYKFLKKDSTEAGYVADILGRIALGNPDISFKLISNGSVLLHTPGNGDLKSAIFSVYGAETAKHVIDVYYKDENVEIKGYVGKAEIARSNRNHQSFYINRRYIRSKIITSAVDAAYSTFLMKNKHPFALLDIRINRALVDVNVHPSKMEVKFSCEQDIYRAVYHAVNDALLSQSAVRTIPESSRYRETFISAPVFTQESFEWLKKEPEIKKSEANSSVTKEYQKNEQKSEPDNDSKHESNREIKHEAKFEPGNESKFESWQGNCGKDIYSVTQNIPGQVPQKSPSCDETKDKVFEKEDKYLTPDVLFKDYKIIGQAFSTYIFIEQGNELYLIDQHAAHERIKYEELKKAYENNVPFSQTLLEPVPIELTAAEYQFALDKIQHFEKLGFVYESFGTNSIIVRSVPLTENTASIREMFNDVLDFIMQDYNNSKNGLSDEALYRIACKLAVKANKKLDNLEINALLEKMSRIENPYTCPHGRPAILKLEKHELEKLFKRIV